MKQVSQAYKDSMAQSIRNQSFVRIQMLSGDASASTDGAWFTSDSKVESWSETDSLSKMLSQQVNTMHTCEWNRCLFDDQWHFVSNDTTEVNEGVVAQMGQGMELTRTFLQPHTFPGVTICFDPACQEYMKSIYISYFDEAGNPIFESAETFVAQPIQYFPYAGANVRKVVIRSGQVFADRRVRILNVFFGLYALFTNKDIKSVSIKRDVDPLSRRAPKTDVQFSLLDYDKQYDFDNPSGKWIMLDEHANVSIQFGYDVSDGATEWLTPDNFVLRGKPSFKDNVATFSATSTLEALTSIYDSSKGKLTSANEEIRKVASNGALKFIISGADSDLGGFSYLRPARHIECLQLLAHASMRTLYTDSNDIVHVDEILVPDWNNPVPMHELSNRDIMYKTQIASKLPLLRDISVTYHRYVEDRRRISEQEYEVNTKTLYDDVPVFPPNTRTMVLRFDVNDTPLENVFVLYEGAYNFEVYANFIIVVITKTPGHENSKLIVAGTKTTDVGSTFKYPVSNVGESEIIDNPVISDPALAVRVLTNSMNYLFYRNTYEFQYRGDPSIEVRDIVALQTPHTERVIGQILMHELVFDGTLHGKLIVKVLIEDTSKPAQPRASLMAATTTEEQNEKAEQIFIPYVIDPVDIRPNESYIKKHTFS